MWNYFLLLLYFSGNAAQQETDYETDYETEDERMTRARGPPSGIKRPAKKPAFTPNKRPTRIPAKRPVQTAKRPTRTPVINRPSSSNSRPSFPPKRAPQAAALTEIDFTLDDVTYKIFKQRATWAEAKDICAQNGLQLATVNTQRASSQIFSQSGIYTWIGVTTDTGSKGDWYWDGSEEKATRENVPWGAIQESGILLLLFNYKVFFHHYKAK